MSIEKLGELGYRLSGVALIIFLTSVLVSLVIVMATGDTTNFAIILYAGVVAFPMFLVGMIVSVFWMIFS